MKNDYAHNCNGVKGPKAVFGRANLRQLSCEILKTSIQEERGENNYFFTVPLTVDPPNRRGLTHQNFDQKRIKKFVGTPITTTFKKKFRLLFGFK